MVHESAEFQCNVKEYRQKKGLSQEDLAKLVDVRRQAIYDIESGRYLPNTAVALRLADVLDTTVEALFVRKTISLEKKVRLNDTVTSENSRLVLANVRDDLVGVPLRDIECIPFGLKLSDGILQADKLHANIFASQTEIEKSLFLLGCDPAFRMLEEHILRTGAGARAHAVFSSSKKALQQLGVGQAHVAGTHFHNTAGKEANLEAVKNLLPDMPGSVITFSLQEEGLMVSPGNPLGIREVEDLARESVRFINREEGAALRTLLDELLSLKGISSALISGYFRQVASHAEGAFHIVCKTADAALGLRVVAESFGLGFIPLAVTRCDLVIPTDLQSHPGVSVLLDALQSGRLKRELNALSGYDAAALGKIISQGKGWL